MYKHDLGFKVEFPGLKIKKKKMNSEFHRFITKIIPRK